MANLFIWILLLSICNSVLFFNSTPGLSVILFIIPLIIFLIFAFKDKKIIKNKKGLFFIIPIILLSSTYFIFNVTLFKLLNVFAIPILLILMMMILLNKEIDIKKLVKNFFNLLFMPFKHIGNAMRLLKSNINSFFKKKTFNKNNTKASKIITTLLITIPLLLFVIYLLSSADVIFGNLFRSLHVYIDKIFSFFPFSNIFGRIVGIGLLFIYLSGLLNYVIFNYNSIEKSKEIPIKKNKDGFTIKTILTCLNVIYLIFCAIQIKSLFFHYISANINYAEYARQGFFQLLIVSFINLVIILIGKRYENSEKSNRFIRTMSIIMIAFTFVILISSFMRMNLYEAHYGYTVLRLLVYIILITEAVLLIPTIMYVVNVKLNLVKIYFIILVTVYTAINFINFDYMIAKRNIDRYFKINDIDLIYLIDSTNTDATKELTRLYNYSTDDSLKQELKIYFENQYEEISYEKEDFRSFNISKSNAKKTLKKIIDSNN